MGGKQRATEQKPREQDVSGKKEALTMWLLKFCLNKDKQMDTECGKTKMILANVSRQKGWKSD